ncbi:metallophosphoesterase family protein [Methylobacterium gossipiicola]|uniref:Serine/threonine protein phosphatase 1 n=1 Tax=Methylobacterium gossipiicola TaxID=582675 RepID=A0A1I2W727_9HYPH|nr:metallophosphoesterase family protein [Methylobacterium gossipiicola]SFG97194.1 serine/threonine protein phosphatase 1 [Methylobacterium gossipiicola]
MRADLTYAIGDIHGCAGALSRLLARIDTHRSGAARRLVFLGDYIDRGPDSAGVIATLRALQVAEPDRVTCLMGNHESMMLDAYRGGFGTTSWLENGGRATLRSFGTPDPQALPRDALAWISALPTVWEDARRYYVHAGFRPGRPGIDPDPETHLWIREPFLSADYDFGRHVVHGHTPQRSGRPDLRAHRTNLDTACVYGATLTAGVFTDAQGPPVEILQVPAEV